MQKIRNNLSEHTLERDLEMLIYIVRHGETDLNAKGCIQGRIEVPLNENGRKLATITGQGLADVVFDCVISSPSGRAFETASLILAENKASSGIPIETDNRLMETNWGVWEGLGCVDSNYQVPREQHQAVWNDTFHFVPPDGGESCEELCARTQEILWEVIQNPAYQGKTILLSTHGMALRAMLNPFYENPEDFWQGSVPPNCAVCIVQAENGKAELISNDKTYYDASLNNEFYMKEL